MRYALFPFLAASALLVGAGRKPERVYVYGTGAPGKHPTRHMRLEYYISEKKLQSIPGVDLEKDETIPDLKPILRNALQYARRKHPEQEQVVLHNIWVKRHYYREKPTTKLFFLVRVYNPLRDGKPSRFHTEVLVLSDGTVVEPELVPIVEK